MTLTTSVETVQGSVPVTIVTLEGELDSSNFEGFVDEALCESSGIGGLGRGQRHLTGQF